MSLYHNRVIPNLELNLATQRPKGEVLPFRVEIRTDALDMLINDAWNGLRIYELFSITRPGDIKHYLWVKIIEASPRVSSGYDRRRSEFDKDKYGPKCPWPDQACPFTIFDGIFFYCGDDTEEEDASWRQMVDSTSFQDFLELCLTQVRTAQAGLRWSGDIVAKHEISLINAEKHEYRFLSEPPRYLSMLGGPQRPLDKHTPAFYKMLEALLAKPEVQSVAYRYGNDYRSFRMFCIEQRKRADKSAKDPGIAFPISVGNDGIPEASPWGNVVRYFDEGLGFGDLMIDPNLRKYDTMKELIESGYRRYGPYVLTAHDNGDIKGYDKESGDGYVLYSLNKREHPRSYQHSRLRAEWNLALSDKESDPECSVYKHERVVLLIDSSAFVESKVQQIADAIELLCRGLDTVTVIDLSDDRVEVKGIRHRIPLNQNQSLQAALELVGNCDVLLVLGEIFVSESTEKVVQAGRDAEAWLMQIASAGNAFSESMDRLIVADPAEFISRSSK